MTRRGNLAAATLAIGMAAAAGAVPAQAAESCQVARADGRAVIERGEIRARAVVGHVLEAGDVVVTRGGGRLTIVCDDGLRMVVGPQTRIGLDRLMRPPTATATPGVALFRGLVGFLRPGGRGDGFVVRTPSAVAAVRSTEWTVEVARRATSAFVREGAVAVGADSGTALLRAGDGVDVSAQGVAGPVRRWGAARVDALSARLGPDW